MEYKKWEKLSRWFRKWFFLTCDTARISRSLVVNSTNERKHGAIQVLRVSGAGHVTFGQSSVGSRVGSRATDMRFPEGGGGGGGGEVERRRG